MSMIVFIGARPGTSPSGMPNISIEFNVTDILSSLLNEPAGYDITLYQGLTSVGDTNPPGAFGVEDTISDPATTFTDGVNFVYSAGFRNWFYAELLDGLTVVATSNLIFVDVP